MNAVRAGGYSAGRGGGEYKASPPLIAGSWVSFRVPRAVGAGHARDIVTSGRPFLLFWLCWSEHAEQALGNAADVGRETGRREVETQHNADQGMQDSQAGVPAQQDHRDSQYHDNGNTDRQSITPFPESGQP